MATKKHIIRLAALAAAILSAHACIYPYDPEIRQDGELPIVVEGDIHIGGSTVLYVSYVHPFEEQVYTAPRIQGYLEGEDGTRIDGVYNTSSTGNTMYMPAIRALLDFDTSGLSDTQRYRVHFETLDGETVQNTFESEWLDVCPAPVIDGLSYSLHEEFDELWIGLSMHCNGAHHFRWSFSETWEYHSDLYSNWEYNPQTFTVSKYPQGSPNLYYCWSSGASPNINIFSTANQIDDRFEELAFHTIPRTSSRLQILYRITVRLEAMSEMAYNYWNNMKQNSEGQGSIFAPVPSEMASNVRCLSDPTIQVVGYLNAASQTEASMYYDDGVEHFYRRPYVVDLPSVKVRSSNIDSLALLYARGYLPYDAIYEDTPTVPKYYLWSTSRCIDCRKSGGTKDKPEGWPNNDK